MKTEKIVDILKYIEGIELILDHLNAADAAVLEKTYTIKTCSEKHLEEYELSKAQVCGLYAWMSEEKTRMEALLNLIPEEEKQKAWGIIYEGK